MPQVKIFDTTLRDGQQCPGAGMSFEKNLEYARLATKLKVDVLEAGFPSASKLDFQIVNAIAAEQAALPESPVIAALCQLRSEQIDITIEALSPAMRAGKARLHVYLPVDPRLMAASLREKADDKTGLVRDLFDFVKRASDAGCEVEFSPEGYSRMGENFSFVSDLIRAAVEGGASVINCPDTIGGASRLEGAEFFVEKMKLHAALVAREFPGREITWSAHCHNDLGLAVNNSIEAVFQGPARQIEGCINGIGERAGNAAIEQCVMILKQFGAAGHETDPLTTRTEMSVFYEISNFVKTNMLPRQPHLPIVGDNAVRHSSGGHTNAILNDPLSYQPFDPKIIGREISIIFGPLSGGNHAKSIIEERGFICDDAEKAQVTQFIKDMYHERRKGITDDEVIKGYLEYRKPFKIEKFDYKKTELQSEVSIRGVIFGEPGEIREVHYGEDSALAALKTLVDNRLPGLEILSHRSESQGHGISAKSLSTIVLRTAHNTTVDGQGADQDIEISAMKALLDAVNNAYIEERFSKKQAK